MSATVFASESKPIVENATTTFTGETFFYDAENDEFLTENKEPISFNDVTIEVPVEKTEIVNGISTQAVQIELFLIKGGLKSTSGGDYTWFFNVDCPTSPLDKPNITVSAQLKGNFTNGSGYYSNVGSVKSEYINSHSDYGNDHTWKTTAKTGYYKFSYTLTNHDMGQTSSSTTDNFLINRTGHEWVYSFSAQDGKSLPQPRADYTKGAIHSRPSNLNSTYYATYKANTGTTLITSLYDVHHIQPLSYGGDNTYNNLIHLPKGTHSGVTGWFRGY